MAQNQSLRPFPSHGLRQRTCAGMASLPREERRIIGEDIMQLGWPLGMPLVRKLDKGLWEVRSRLPNRIARVIFTTGESRMVLLHGFIKKSQKTLQDDLKLAKSRLHLPRHLPGQTRQPHENQPGDTRPAVAPNESSVTLHLLEQAALALGRKLKIELT